MKWIAPNACVFCGMRVAEDAVPICAGCDADLPRVPQALVLPEPPLHFMVAPLAYDFPVNAAIKAWKFRRRLDYTTAFVSLVSDALACLPEKPDAFLAAPLHWRRQALRGFNQAGELATPLGRMFGIPVIKNVVRVRHTPSQSGLGAAERQRNLRTAFRVRGRIKEKHVVIADDVVTTGATVAQIGKVLLSAGAEKVSVLAIARAL